MKSIEDYADLVESGPQPYANDTTLRREVWKVRGSEQTIELSECEPMFGGRAWIAVATPPRDPRYRTREMIGSRDFYSGIKRVAGRWIARGLTRHE